MVVHTLGYIVTVQVSTSPYVHKYCGSAEAWIVHTNETVTKQVGLWGPCSAIYRPPISTCAVTYQSHFLRCWTRPVIPACHQLSDVARSGSAKQTRPPCDWVAGHKRLMRVPSWLLVAYRYTSKVWVMVWHIPRRWMRIRWLMINVTAYSGDALGPVWYDSSRRKKE